MAELILDGESLSIDALAEISALALDPKAKLRLRVAGKAQKKIRDAERFLNKLARSGETVYGLNTGFGYFAKTRIKPNEIEQLQRNIIRSHACGVGEELPRDLVLAMWLVLLNSVCRGHRGLSLSKLDTILRGLEAGILACVPARGSVGASGDLAPSAHAVLATIGEGECTVPSGKGFARVKAGAALQKAGLTPIVLGPEGRALPHQRHTAHRRDGRQALARKRPAAEDRQPRRRDDDRSAARLPPRHRRTAAARAAPARHWECGKEIASYLGDTEIARSHAECGRVQDAYSLRCAPQVHGMVWDELASTKEILEREINATTDNPLLFPDRGEVIHGGNFHAIYPARACDRLGMALATLASISERRTNSAMRRRNPACRPSSSRTAALNSGLMMIQTTAAALVSECKSLSFPASVDSIPTNNDQEDHVSMGPGAGLKALKIAEHARYVIAIELYVAAQALDMLKPLKSSPQLEKVRAKIRKKVPYLKHDRILSPDVEAICAMVKSGELFPKKISVSDPP
ncbi:MAG: aromatic amino acid lyase [Alphaproteobacteria bacterium]